MKKTDWNGTGIKKVPLKHFLSKMKMLFFLLIAATLLSVANAADQQKKRSQELFPMCRVNHLLVQVSLKKAQPTVP